MVAWYWLIVAFVGGLVFTVATWDALEWNEVVSAVLAGIAIPFIWVALFPIKFFRSYVKPISSKRWAECLETWENWKYWKIDKNTYLCYDRNTKKLFNKFFLIRVKGT
jgi:hypothetical protein